MYAPDLRRLGPIVAEWWANVTAATYCNNTNPALSAALSGIIVQLQPVSGPYVENLMVFLVHNLKHTHTHRVPTVTHTFALWHSANWLGT